MEIAGKTRVLVVDDEHSIANSLSWVLNKEGFETRAAYSGEEAVEAAESFRPNALICDVLMAGISGIETAMRIKDKIPSCKVLIISGHVSTPDLATNGNGHKHQFDFLSKPVHPRVLIEKLHTLLGTPADSA
ncbi:MAG TPA: response regulator [Terracidiphilus sp.]|nr:response regulator [Terracidiphilus sp.]